MPRAAPAGRRLPVVVLCAALGLAGCAGSGSARGGASADSGSTGGGSTGGAAAGAASSRPASHGSAGSPPGAASGPGRAAADTGPPIPLGPLDWPTYHRTNDRAGAAPGVPAVHGLQPAWRAALNGAVYGQPLVLGDLVVAATEADTVYGLGLTDGRVRWRTDLGSPQRRSDLPCGDIDPLGITGTPGYDPVTGSVFVVAETAGGRHDLVALSARTGGIRFRRSLDVTARDRLAEQQRGALAVAGGRVYVPFGGLAGDCGDYVGYLTATPVRGDGPTTSYQIPTSREGGIWAPSGPAIDPAGQVWVAVGNGASVGDPYDGSDSVLRLSRDLSLRLDYFAPSDWGSQNAADADLGSTGPVLIGSDRVLVAGKVGQVYLLDRAGLGGIGGQLASLGGCTGFGGMAWDAGLSAAFVPCSEGLLRVDVGTDTLAAGWRAGPDLIGSPVLGGSAVWALEPAAGVLRVLAEADGHLIAGADTGTASRFASPVLSGRYVLVPTLRGVTALAIR